MTKTREQKIITKLNNKKYDFLPISTSLFSRALFSSVKRTCLYSDKIGRGKISSVKWSTQETFSDKDPC